MTLGIAILGVAIGILGVVLACFAIWLSLSMDKKLKSIESEFGRKLRHLVGQSKKHK